ncbi:hypothetical protein O3P69_009681 [Scylla paramamosain]|uniref:Uncharacterized protein n=1 Tax=Scylla paramamosain TaxID=85552 RepID=A0AAW0SFD6_SCYPA
MVLPGKAADDDSCKSSSYSHKLFVATYEDLDKMLLAYTTPMDTALYWCILTNMIGLASILFFADQLQRCYIPMGEKPVSMGVAGWYVLSALLQQSEDLLGCGTGSNTYPISSAAWVTYRVGCGVSLIVYTSYSATLVSHLAVEQSVTLPFSNLQELSRQSGWDAGCNNNDLFKGVGKRAAAREGFHNVGISTIWGVPYIIKHSQTCVGSQTGECRVLRKAWQKVESGAEVPR